MPDLGTWIVLAVCAFFVISAYVSAQASNRKGWSWGASVVALLLGPLLGPLAALLIRDRDADAW